MLRRHKTLILTCAAALITITCLENIGQAGTIVIDPAPVALSTLVGNPDASYTVGDKKFTGFSYLSTGDMPGADNVNVAGYIDDDGNFGIQFQGAFADLPSSQGGSDAKIEYMVEALDPKKLISDAHLSGNPTLLGTTGSVSVTETFLPLGASGEYTMTIYDDESLGQKLVDWTDFVPPVRKLNVQKDILMISTPNSQTMTLSFVNQTFSQIEVPEPASLLISLLGMVSLVGYARRRRRQDA
jgi:hypothetical protein